MKTLLTAMFLLGTCASVSVNTIPTSIQVVIDGKSYSCSDSSVPAPVDTCN